MLRYAQQNAFPTVNPAVAILGANDYDQLFSEVSTSVADFMSCDQSQISLEFQRKCVAHFYYRGVLVIRSPGVLEGFFFA
jgi:hypothetical protein